MGIEDELTRGRSVERGTLGRTVWPLVGEGGGEHADEGTPTEA